MLRSALAAAGLGFLTLVAGIVVNLVHFRFFEVRVVLYSAVLDMVLGAVFVSAVYMVLLARKLPLSPLEAGLAALAGLLLAINFAISVPTIIDRSLSIYLLEKLQQRGGAIRQDAFPSVFANEYMPEHRLVDIRLTEQLNSGTITIVDGCVRLTPRGERIVAFTRFYRQNMLPKYREIMGQITDALTDPFRNSAPAADYGCPRDGEQK